MQSYIRKKIYILVGIRCFKSHLIKKLIFEDFRFLKIHFNTMSLSASELSKMVETLSIKYGSTLFDKIGVCSLSEKQIEVFTRLT